MTASIAPGEAFSVFGSNAIDKKGTLGTEITILWGGSGVTKIHTSCSQPLYIGLEFGPFRLIDGASRNGGRFCPEP